jgi:hypothetical protein
MKKAALFVGWGSIIPGREKQAQKVLGDAVTYCQGLQTQGRIDSFEAFFLEPHGGDLEGFVLVRGDREQIAQIRTEEEFLKSIVAVQLVHQKVGVVGAYAGEELQKIAQIWNQQESKLLE